VDPGSPVQKKGIQGCELPLTIAGAKILAGGDVVTEIRGFSSKYKISRKECPLRSTP
jgi:hypothetical protein